MNGVKTQYRNSMLDTIISIDPSLNPKKVEKIIASVLKENILDPPIYMDNSINGNNANITLTELCNWVEKRDPVISGNATFYMQPEELESPTSYMLRSLKKGRKVVKKAMFKMIPDSYEYNMADLDQGNQKVIMNSDYGGSGSQVAAFYTKEGPPATTLMAQSIITCMAAFFEGFIGDNQMFFHINELYDWMNTVLTQKKDMKVPSWVIVPTDSEILHRFANHFNIFNRSDYDCLSSYISNRSESEKCYLYYANNLNEFIIRHHEVYSQIMDVLTILPHMEAVVDEVPDEYRDQFTDENRDERVLAYNKWMSRQMFLDPYNIPDTIEKQIRKLNELTKQFVFVEYLTPDSIVKLNNHKRNTVLLVDTDSNMVNADIFVSHILDKVFPGQLFGRSKLYNEMILTNVLAAIVGPRVEDILDFYGRVHHMGKEARAELTMKNEFMFRRLFLMNTKKRYAASIVLREGNIIFPFKLEIKGMDFIKAGVTDDVTKRFTKMLEKHVLFPDEIQLHELMKDLKSFEKEIFDDISHGGTRFLKPQLFKEKDAYKEITNDHGVVIGSKAWSLPVFRGSIVWNELYPTQKIYSLDRVKIIKLISIKEEDLERIRYTFPNEYQMVKEKIYNNPDPNIRKAGLKVIAVPKSVKKIPEWIQPLVDCNIIVSDVISSFRSVLDALKLEEVYFKTPNGNANLTSCLISL